MIWKAQSSSRSIAKPTAVAVKKPVYQGVTTVTPTSTTGKRPKTAISQLSSVPAADQTRPALNREQLRVVNEDLFDQFMEKSLHVPLNVAFEPIVKIMFNCFKVIIWIDSSDDGCLYSPTLKQQAGYEDSLPGFVFRTKNVIQVRDPSHAPNGFKNYPAIIPAGCPQLLFTLTAAGVARAIVHVIQQPRTTGFTPTDMEIVTMIVRKFETYRNAIFTSHGISSIALGLFSTRARTENPLRMMKRHFQCDVCEMWQVDRSRGSAVVHSNKGPVRTVSLSDAGIVGRAAVSGMIVNVANCKEEEGYNSISDGDHGPLLLVMQTFGRDIWVLVLRGRQPQFSAADEAQLSALLSFVVGSYTGFNTSSEKAIFMTQLAELMHASLVLTSSLAPADVIGLIKEQAVKLMECQRALVFVVGKNQEQLTGYYSATSKKISTLHGVAGHVSRTGEIMQAGNPRELPMYDPVYDSDPSYTPTSILAVPVRNASGEIIAVLSLLSKSDSGGFTVNDAQILPALSVFVGIALQNVRSYKRANQLTKKLRSFVQMLLHSGKETELQPMLQEILSNARSVLSAKRVTFFVPDPSSNEMSQFMSVGDASRFGAAFANEVKEKKKMRIVLSEEIDAKAKALGLPEEDEERLTLGADTGSRYSQVSGLFANPSLAACDFAALKRKERNICCVPLLNVEGSLLGVLETDFPGETNADNDELLRFFGAMATLSLERLNLQEMAVMGYGDIEISDWMTEDERLATEIPAKLKVSEDLYSIMFNSELYDGIASFKVVFKIFDRLGLLDSYSITAERLFRFLIKVRSYYYKSARYNWKHAMDVTQFVFSQIIVGKLDRSYIGQFELLGLLVAAICHDVGHEGFPHEDEKVLGVPLGLLMKKQSALEADHCAKAMEVMRDPACNLFHALNDKDYRSMWNMVIGLILATDMSKHYKVIDELQILLDTDEFDGLGDHEHRFILMKCILKVADIAVVVRPLSDVSKWNIGVAEEFYRQSDLSLTEELVYTEDGVSYEHLDLEGSLMAFFKNACIPLARVVSRSCPLLRTNTEMIKDNIQRWCRYTGRSVPMFEREPKLD